jgi:hypothetical protein
MPGDQDRRDGEVTPGAYAAAFQNSVLIPKVLAMRHSSDQGLTSNGLRVSVCVAAKSLPQSITELCYHEQLNTAV